MCKTRLRPIPSPHANEVDHKGDKLMLERIVAMFVKLARSFEDN